MFTTSTRALYRWLAVAAGAGRTGFSFSSDSSSLWGRLSSSVTVRLFLVICDMGNQHSPQSDDG